MAVSVGTGLAPRSTGSSGAWGPLAFDISEDTTNIMGRGYLVPWLRVRTVAIIAGIKEFKNNNCNGKGGDVQNVDKYTCRGNERMLRGRYDLRDRRKGMEDGCFVNRYRNRYIKNIIDNKDREDAGASLRVTAGRSRQMWREIGARKYEFVAIHCDQLWLGKGLCYTAGIAARGSREAPQGVNYGGRMENKL